MPAPPPQELPKRRASTIIWAAAVVVLAGFGGLLGLDLFLSYEQEFKTAQRDAENLSYVLEEQVKRSSEKIDLVLAEAVHDYAPLLAAGEPLDVLAANRDLQRREAGLAEVQAQSLRIIDARGEVVLSAGDSAELPKVNVADRSYFHQQESNRDDRLIVSEPILSRFTGAWLITYSRRINSPDGAFGGLIQTAVRADYLEQMFQILNVAPHGSVALLSGDFRLVARKPATPDKQGQQFSMPEMAGILASSQTAGSYHAASRIDGTERVFHFRRLEATQQIVNVGVAPQDFLAGWYKKALVYCISWLALGSAVLCLILLERNRARRIFRLNEELLDKAYQAEAANRTKSTFLAHMSHEIRTPINGITGIIHLLRREGVSPRQAEHLGKVENASQHLLSVINDVLDVSKIEAGKLTLENIPLAPSTLIDDVLALLADRAADKGITLQCVTTDPVPDVLGDPTRIRQCLLNYVGNAIKFTPAGRVTVRLQVAAETAASITLKFEVEDSGIGISPENQPRLFAAFAQADASTSREYGGTGLGLNITRQLAQLMGGEAGFSSQPGQGSLFWFSVTLAKSTQPAADARNSHEAAAESRLREKFTGTPILLVEDEPINQEIAQMLLEDVGLAVHLAKNGEEALASLGKGSYPVVLMDMMMPRMDGLEASRRLRAMPDIRQPAVIAMTANVYADDRERCQAAGMNDFVAKPIEPAALFATLLHWLEKGAAETAAASLSEPMPEHVAESAGA